ncbi:type II toxin-antitoxin system HicB family antitoxin [Geoglobus ahangari]
MEQLEVKKLRFPVIVEVDEDGYYIVSCPLFRGCHSYGETMEEALENIKEAIEMCLEEEGIDENLKFVGYREVEIEYAKTATDKGKRAP